jgi:hypothetical protein
LQRDCSTGILSIQPLGNIVGCKPLFCPFPTLNNIPVSNPTRKIIYFVPFLGSMQPRAKEP